LKSPIDLDELIKVEHEVIKLIIKIRPMMIFITFLLKISPEPGKTGKINSSFL
jgi:hypothetical protein